jgi:hypothetical protein
VSMSSTSVRGDRWVSSIIVTYRSVGALSSCGSLADGKAQRRRPGDWDNNSILWRQ